MHWVLLLAALVISFSASGVAGFAAHTTNSPVALEAFKLLASFTLVSVAGIIIKLFVDRRIEEERLKRTRENEVEQEKNRRYEEWERTRSAIVAEFVDIFSKFYSLRKLYHSARSRRNQLYTNPSPEYSALLRASLQQATELEGRYGGLKTRIVQHFKLPSGDHGSKSIEELKAKKQSAIDEGDQRAGMRCSLDILAESYDDWRHALEEGRRIDVDESWAQYEHVLSFLENEVWQAGASGA